MKTLRKFLGVFSLFGAVSMIILSLTKFKEQFLVGVFGCLFYGFIAYICFKQKTKNSNIQIPKETIQDIKNNYSKKSVSLIVQQIQESYNLMCKATDIDTLCKRYEFGLKKCMTLKELEVAGLYPKIKADDFISMYTNNYYSLIHECYKRYCEKARKELKTEVGIQKRINNFWTSLGQYLDEFTIQDLKNNFQ